MLLLLACLTITQLGWAQEESDEDAYDSEFVWGVNLNTNGGLIGGVIFRYSQALDEKMYQHFALEIVNVKHPKEFRYQEPVIHLSAIKAITCFRYVPITDANWCCFGKLPKKASGSVPLPPPGLQSESLSRTTLKFPILSLMKRT